MAGHDHPVAAIGVGAVGPDELFNSSGTADVLARSIPGTLPEAERQQVVTAGWSIGRHVLPDTSLLLAGVSGGLLLRRVLAALGAEAEPARSALDQASLSVGTCPPACRSPATAGPRTTSSCASATTPRPPRSGRPPCATPQTQARLLLTDIEKVVGPHRRAVAAGGWTRMASVRAAKAAVIDALSFSPVVQPGVIGAALLAAFALRRLASRTSPASSGKERHDATPPKARTLDDIAADDHVFSIIAMDQRNTLRRMFTAVGLDATDDDLRVAKADVARVLTPVATGLLFDPTYGVPAITAGGGARPGAAGCSSPPSRPSGAATTASRAPTATPS